MHPLRNAGRTGRHGCLVLILYAALNAQVVQEIPYDWSGQYGLSTVNGFLLWNQDWFAGPLLFDGTANSYLPRFGKSTRNRFHLAVPGGLPNPAALPDTSLITSHLDYLRGDYANDQFGIGFSFQDGRQKTAWEGFKRTYADRFGQYLVPGRSLAPIQQSYRLDYLSLGRKGQRLEAGLGRYITASGIPDSAYQGIRREWITSAGFHSLLRSGSWQWDTRVAQVHQHSRTTRPSRKGRYTQYLVRNHLALNWIYTRSPRLGAHLGSTLDRRDYRWGSLTWLTVSGGVNFLGQKLSLGGTTAGGDGAPFLSLSLHSGFAGWNMDLLGQFISKPAHVSFQELSSSPRDLETWWLGVAVLRKQVQTLELETVIESRAADTYLDFMQLNPDSGLVADTGRARALSALIRIRWTPFPAWYTQALVRHLGSTHATLSDGFENRLALSLGTRQRVLNGRARIHLELEADAWLNPFTDFGYDPYRDIPYRTLGSDLERKGIWLVNFRAEAEISAAVITYRILNLGPLLVPLWRRVRPGLTAAELEIPVNPAFPHLGSMKTISVDWFFRN